MLNWIAIKPALIALFASLAELPLAGDVGREVVCARWDGEPDGYDGAAQMTISKLAEAASGMPESRFNVVPAEEWRYGDSWGGPLSTLREQQVTPVIVTVRVKIECYAHVRGAEADTYADNLRGSLWLTEATEALDAIGFGLFEIGNTTTPKTNRDQRVLSTAILDIRFHAEGVKNSAQLRSRIETLDGPEFNT